ncbi:hypothetical protein [Streptomyces sp. NPDC060010]|uniref:hypothetical protein n=1 Tax=Streptomyces sp. NPDC060010 TaxID=3347036 RepID=UPI0036A987C8
MSVIDPAVSVRLGAPGARRLVGLLAEVAHLLENPDRLRLTDEQAAVIGQVTNRAEPAVGARELAAELRAQL